MMRLMEMAMMILKEGEDCHTRRRHDAAAGAAVGGENCHRN